MADYDLARRVENVLIALETRPGEQWLTPDQQIAVLAAAITAVNNRRGDTELFRPLVKEA